MFTEATFPEILLPSSGKINDKKKSLTIKCVAEACDENEKQPIQ